MYSDKNNEVFILKSKQMESLFTKDEKKQAKFNYKISLKNIIEHNKKRMELASHLVKQEIPNWNIKFSFLRN